MSSFKDPNAFADPEDSELVRNAKRTSVIDPVVYSYTEHDVILYNLGIGATEKELKWTYEGDEEFQALPTLAFIPGLTAGLNISLDFLPNYNPAKLLHGEQYLNIKSPLPTSGELVTDARILEVLDKGKAASVALISQTREKRSGKLLFENQATLFIRGAGGFGGRRVGKDRGNATAVIETPSREPDAVVEEKTASSQAALYRLSGDSNPLHILPEFAAIGGFDRPILHGLCTVGIASKHILKTYGPYEDIKVRMVNVVYPGETIVTKMWKEQSRILFTVTVKERNSVVVANAAVTLVHGSKSKL